MSQKAHHQNSPSGDPIPRPSNHSVRLTLRLQPNSIPLGQNCPLVAKEPTRSTSPSGGFSYGESCLLHVQPVPRSTPRAISESIVLYRNRSSRILVA